MKKVTERPTTPDGFKYVFDCCPEPDVWEHDDGSKVCETCGHDWTEAL